MSNEIQTIDAQVTLVVEQNQIQPETAKSLGTSFQPLFESARKVLEQSRAVVVTDPEQKLQIKLAREYRLELKRIRLASDKQRKELKDESLRRGRAIDGFHNILLEMTQAEENRLEEQEKIAERILAERREKLLQERLAKLAPFGVDLSFVNVVDMPDATFEQFLDNSKAAFERKQEEARKAEAERIRLENERLKEEQRIREENARLKKEAEEREAAAKIERERIEKEKAEAEAKARKEREEAEAKAKAERDAIEAKAAEERRIAAEKAKAEKAKADQARKIAEQKLAAERAEKERLERELAAKRAEEEKRIAAEKEAARLAALAPDREKLLAFAARVRSLEQPKLSADAIDAQNFVAECVERCATLIECEAKEMALANPFPTAVNA